MVFNKANFAKALLVGLLICCGSSPIHAQVFSKILNAMMDQIADLEACLDDLEKGYQEVESGLHTIGDIKNGEFNLHKLFFGSLKAVNPRIAEMSEVAEVASLEAAIVKQTTMTLSSAKQNRWLQPAELAYLSKFYSALLRAGTEDLNALADLITDDHLEMADGERIQRIQAIDKDIQSQYGILQAFDSEAGLLAQQRQREFQTSSGIGNLYGR